MQISKHLVYIQKALNRYVELDLKIPGVKTCIYICEQINTFNMKLRPYISTCLLSILLSIQKTANLFILKSLIRVL